MGFHHVAFATNDTEATHRFYTEVMGFELVKVVASETPTEGPGYSKHFFYSTGPADGDDSGDHGMIAFWEIHDPAIGEDFGVDLNKSAGLPWWVNHVAFDAHTREDLDTHRRARLQQALLLLDRPDRRRRFGRSRHDRLLGDPRSRDR